MIHHSMARKLAISAAAAACIMAGPALAQDHSTAPRIQSLPTLQNWMSPEIADAWSDGYFGQGATITVIDDFWSPNRFVGNLDGRWRIGTHGAWTQYQASLVAPQARIRIQDFSNNRAVRLSRGFDVINLSYGMFAQDGFDVSAINWGARENSIINHAFNGSALVVKAAGNDGAAVGEGTIFGDKDYLGAALIGAQSAIFVGALDRNGTIDNKASLAWYSNTAGNDPTVQNQFLTVGVESHKTNLAGTSFAAPIIAGYGAIIHSKFDSASPTQVANRLLDTARTDTIRNYDPSLHGRGEASLTRALAPAAIR